MSDRRGMASSGTDSGNTIITYKIEYNKHFPETVKQLQADDAIDYAAKDFLTFIFCGLNDEYLEKVNSQLKDKGLMIKDMNGTTVTCRVTTPIDQQSQLDVKKVIHDIQASVLSIQDQLDFEELPWPEAGEIVASLQKSSAKENNLLQFHLYRKKDQSQVMLLVYAKSCKEEINNYTGTKYITHLISMKPFRAQALLNFGLLQATEKRFGRNFVMNADTSNLSVMVKADCNANIDAVLLFISEFDNSVIHRPVSCHLHQLNVLELPKVKNGLRNAIVSYNVFLEIDTLKSFHLFSQSEESLTKSVKIIEDTLVELQIPIKNAIKDVLRKEDWKKFTDSVFRNGDNNEFIISESEKNLEITGLRNQVNDVVGFINGFIDEETERINVEVQNDTSADLPIDNIERFSYLKQFYKPPEKVHLRHSSSQARQGLHLTGPAMEVQKAKEHMHHLLNTISVKTLKFNDNGYLNTDDGLQFLQDKIIRDCTVLFAFPENKHSLSSQDTARSEKAYSIDDTDDSDKKIYSWEIGKKCKVVLMVEDDVEAEVSIQIVEHKTKGEPYKLTWIINHKKQCLVASLSLPFYRPGAPLDDVNHSFHKVFEKMMEDKLKSLSVSIDSLGSWPIGCFVPRLLRAFIHYVTMAPALNLSLVVISSTEDNFEKVKGICKEIIYGEDKKQMPDSSICPRVIKGSLHEMKISLRCIAARQRKADVLVNTVSAELNLAKGMVSRSLKKAAGQAIQAELSSKYSGGLGSDEIAVTSGYQLNCQYVFHGILTEYNSKTDDSAESLYRFVTECLDKASKRHFSSIAFPVIGTGRLGYPPDLVASCMFRAVSDFKKKQGKTALEDVTFVVYPEDQTALLVFQQQYEEFQRKTQFEGESTVALQLVGPDENIDKAEQYILDKLEWLEIKDTRETASQQTIHGVSDVSYKLLQFFHKDVFDKYVDKGCEFRWEDDILTINADFEISETVKTEILHCLSMVKDCQREEIVIPDDISMDTVENVLEIQTPAPENVCIILNKTGKKIGLYGKCVSELKKERAHLSTHFQKIVSPKSESKISEATRSDKEVFKSTGRPLPHKIVNKRNNGESAKSGDRNGGRNISVGAQDVPKTVIVPNISYELYKVMDKMYKRNLDKLLVTYINSREEATVLENNKKEFEKILSQVRQLQTEEIPVPLKYRTQMPLDYPDDVVVVHNPSRTTISVFGQDMKSVQKTVHKIKVNFGFLEQNKRAQRHLTDSFQVDDYADHDDQTNQAEYKGGARPKHQIAHLSGVNNLEIFHTKEKIPVLVYTKDILNLDVDCIVNAANDTLRHGGGIAEVISRAAGKSLDDECNYYIKKNGKLRVGEVFVSGPGKLKYKCVLHTVGPKWTDYKPYGPDDVWKCKRDLYNAILNSFYEAENNDMQTIAVPAVSSAAFKVPTEICTEMYAAAILAYSFQSSPRRLKEIHFIDCLPAVIYAIQQTFRVMIPNGQVPDFSQKLTGKRPSNTPVSTAKHEHKMNNPSPVQQVQTSGSYAGFPYIAKPSSKELQCHFSRTMKLLVSTGGIFDKHNIDAVVCSEDKSGQGKGFIATELTKRGPMRYKSAKTAAFSAKSIQFGDVVVCNGGETGFKRVFHTIMWFKDPNDTEFERQKKFTKMFKAVLNKVTSEKCQTVVMPLLFTGKGHVDTNYCAERFLESCLQFSKESKHKLTIYMVNNEKAKTESIQRAIEDFVRLQGALQISSSQPHILGKPNGSKQRAKSPEPTSSFRSKLEVTGSIKQTPRFSQSVREGRSHDSYDTTRDMVASFRNSDFNADDDSAMASKLDENCVICMDRVNKPKKLKCGHIFCTDCIDSYFSSCKKVCPTCGVVCGIVKGDQPKGTMDIKQEKYLHCAGFEGAGSFVITYSFPSGIQGPEHPNPGKPYKGITRTAYLPNTSQGYEIMKMLEVAFDRRLVFTIGSSRTTGHEGVITWNDIHHKTNPKPHATFGYPDSGYFDRVKDELAVKGVTVDDIRSSHGR